MRGVEILEDRSHAVIGTMFSFHHVFRETAQLIHNFVKHKFHFLRINEDSQNAWYTWMLASANNGKLNFWFPPPFRNYVQPKGPQLKKRSIGLSQAQQRMVENVGKGGQKALDERHTQKKMVMNEDGQLVEAEEVVDPNKKKFAAEQAKRDAKADADAEHYEKANRWNASK